MGNWPLLTSILASIEPLTKNVIDLTDIVGEKAQNWTGLAGPTFLDVSINDPAKNGPGSRAV